MSPHIQIYLDEALTILREHALRKTALDWESTRRDVLAQSVALSSIADTYPIIRQVIARLGDRHSALLTPAAVQHDMDGLSYQVGLIVAHPTGVVVQVLPDSPAAAATIQVGDVIVTLDGVAVADWEADAFRASLLADAVALLVSDSSGIDRRSLTLTAALFMPTTTPVGHLVGDAIGYLDVPAMDGPAMLARPYAEQLHALIGACDHQELRGWIVDLRRNTGGNMWPMLAGLGPLLGDGDLGAFVYPDGATEDWSYHQGKAELDGWTMTRVVHPYTLLQPDLPVAILLSPITRSSGELTALALHARQRTRTFGEPTAGVPTANAPFPLSDGALIMLTVAKGADRNGQSFDAALAPDQPIPIDWRQIGTMADPVMLAATNWISDHPSA